jgi:hypothetical protein
MTFEEAKIEVGQWLTLKMRTGKFSQLLLEQLTLHVIERTVHVHCVYDEIGHLEDPTAYRSTGTKPAAPFKYPPLTGFWHQHWFEPRFMAMNLLNYARSAEAKPIFEEMSAAINRGEYPARSIHELVIGGHEQRAGMRTGEWIVFARIGDANYYLTLGTHDEGDERILERIKLCVPQFPQIMPLLPSP